MSLEWFAIRTKSKREAVVSASLTGKGFDQLLPLYRYTDSVGKCTRVKPLFPGYVFGRFDAPKRLPVLTIPGVFGIVNSAGVPIPLDEREVSSVRTLADSDLTLNPHPYLHVGHKVRLTDGPLTGVEGIVFQSEPNKIVVSVTLLQRSLSVIVPREWLEPTKAVSQLPELVGTYVNKLANHLPQ